MKLLSLRPRRCFSAPVLALASFLSLAWISGNPSAMAAEPSLTVNENLPVTFSATLERGPLTVQGSISLTASSKGTDQGAADFFQGIGR